MQMWIRKFMTSRAFGVVLFALATALAGAVGFSLLNGTDAFSREDVNGYPLAVKSLLDEAKEADDKGRMAEAVLAYEKFLVLKPDVPEGYFRLGALYFKMGLPSKSEETFLRAVSANQDVAEAYSRLGYLAEGQGDLPKALSYYKKAEENFLDNPALFFNMGNVYAGMDQKEEAIECYKKAVAKNPSYMDAFVNLSVLSFHKGLYADADFYLRKAVDLGYQAPSEYVRVLSEKVK